MGFLIARKSLFPCISRKILGGVDPLAGSTAVLSHDWDLGIAMPMTDLEAQIPRLLPFAVSWARLHEALILATGRFLTDVEWRLALASGVQKPSDVRLKLVKQIPTPDNPELRLIANQTGIIGPDTGAITLGRGIYILDGRLSNRLLSHELRHVHQYERAGTLQAFLQTYLLQIATVGYDQAPLELDAQRYERDAP
jgi:hypothetical protein